MLLFIWCWIIYISKGDAILAGGWSVNLSYGTQVGVDGLVPGDALRGDHVVVLQRFTAAASAALSSTFQLNLSSFQSPFYYLVLINLLFIFL